MTPLERVLQRIEVDPETGCWLWPGAVTSNGYGKIGMGSRSDGTRRTVSTHVLTYTMMIGPVPEGMELDHLCRVRNCCFPGHLEPVTHHENVVRGENGYRNKTHCKNGHPFDAENTAPRRDGGKRRCLTCKRASGLATYYRKKALA